jgi:hypothetical protein
MHKTKHIEKRMAQRGISKAMIELVLNYGEESGDKVVLGRRKAKRLLEDFRTLIKIIDKGGVTVVAQGEALITAYNYEGRGQ